MNAGKAANRITELEEALSAKEADLAALRGENERLLNECRFLGKARWDKETELCQRIFEVEAALAERTRELAERLEWSKQNAITANLWKNEADAISRENAELKAALEAAKADMEEARAKSDCGHPSECMVQEQGREDFDETCLWCAQLAAADQVAEYEKGLALESSRQREAALRDALTEANRLSRTLDIELEEAPNLLGKIDEVTRHAL